MHPRPFHSDTLWQDVLSVSLLPSARYQRHTAHVTTRLPAENVLRQPRTRGTLKSAPPPPPGEGGEAAPAGEAPSADEDVGGPSISGAGTGAAEGPAAGGGGGAGRALRL